VLPRQKDRALETISGRSENQLLRILVQRRKTSFSFQLSRSSLKGKKKRQSLGTRAGEGLASDTAIEECIVHPHVAAADGGGWRLFRHAGEGKRRGKGDWRNVRLDERLFLSVRGEAPSKRLART